MHQVLRSKIRIYRLHNDFKILTLKTCAIYRRAYGHARCTGYTVHSQSTTMAPKQNGELENNVPFSLLFLLQWVMFRFPFAVSIPNESCSEHKNVMMMVTVSDAGKRLIKTTQARPDCRQLLFPIKVVIHLHSLKLTLRLKIRNPKRKAVFQPSISIYAMLVSGRVNENMSKKLGDIILICIYI